MGRNLTCWVNSTKVSHSGCPRRISKWLLSSAQQMRSHACCSQRSVEGAPAACPPSPLHRGLMQAAQRGGRVSLALMWRGQCLGAVTVQNWWGASAAVCLSIGRLKACASHHPNRALYLLTRAEGSFPSLQTLILLLSVVCIRNQCLQFKSQAEF